MKDIDFDELDRAVSSLMGSPAANGSEIKKTDTPVQQPIEPAPVVIPEPVDLDAPIPVVDTIPTTEPVPVKAAGPLKVQVPRRSGRFMDMVNAPATTKPRPIVQPETPIQPSTPSREGLTITPQSDSPVQSAPVQFSAPEESSSNLPDPLDSVQDQASSPALDMSVPVQPAPAAIETTASGESPFILDAKVSKRPLNAGSALDIDALNRELEAEVSLDEQPRKTDELIPAIDLQPVETFEDVATVADEPIEDPKIPELDTDLVAIEAKENLNDVSTTTTSSVAQPSSADSAPTATPLGASSIAQQYTSQPSSGDQSHAAIYDASQYPDTVTHPAKNKSGWLWVLWVLLLLGIGAGGALLLYSLGIIP